MLSPSRFARSDALGSLIERSAWSGTWFVLATIFGVVACSSAGSADSGAGGSTDNSVAGSVSSGGISGASAEDAGQGGMGAASGRSADSAGATSSGGIAGFATAGRSGQGGSSAEAGASPGGASGGSGGVSGTSSASGAGGQSGAAGSSAYKPCPASGTPCKILPFGDSITRGVKSSDDAGYRSQLFKLVVAANQKVTFVGSLTNGPTQVSGQSFPRTHEGHPGWTIDPGYNTSGNYGGISSLVPSPALNGNPNIILLQIGTNDVFFKDTSNMSTRLEALIDKIAQHAPDALIVLAQITPLSTANSALTAYNSKIPGIVQSHAAKGQHIIGVDMSKLPVATDLSPDGTHPNDRGYGYMAGIWYAAIENLLPK
jgi:lysophospholipase L1-like esterase